MGRTLRPSRRRHRSARPAAPPRRRHPYRGGELPAAPACRSDPGKSPSRAPGRLHLAASAPRPPAETPTRLTCTRLIAGAAHLGKITSPNLGKFTPPLTAAIRRLAAILVADIAGYSRQRRKSKTTFMPLCAGNSVIVASTATGFVSG